MHCALLLRWATGTFNATIRRMVILEFFEKLPHFDIGWRDCNVNGIGNAKAKIRYSDDLIAILQQFAIPQMENVEVLLLLILRVFVYRPPPPPPALFYWSMQRRSHSINKSLLFIHFDFKSHNIDETTNEKRREWGNFHLLPDTWPFLLKCVCVCVWNELSALSICSFFHFAVSANIANQKGQIKVYFHSLAPWLRAFFIIYQRSAYTGPVREKNTKLTTIL